MSTIKNPTNLQIATELCKANPTSKYATLLGYDKATEQLGVKDLSIFNTSTPDIANEFIGDMANKIVVQRAYDLFRGYKMPFGLFLKEMSKLGDAEELLTCELATPTNYDGDDTNPFDATKPSIKLAWIKTEDKKVVDVKLNYEIWSGAFLSEQGLSNITGIILKNLRTAIEEYIRKAIRDDLSSKITKTCVVETISTAGETANSQKAYEEVLKLVMDMTIPSTSFNESGVETFTPMGDAVLVLNTRYQSSFDVNVIASLFNSAKIGETKYFADVIVTDLGSDANVVGYVLDKECYLWGNRIDIAQSISNPATLDICTYYHRWIKRALVPFRQAVKLVTSE